MLTSDLKDAVRRRMRAYEVAALALGFSLLPELLPGRPGLASGPHPGWIAVLILSARYGSAGFLAGATGSAAAAGLGSAVSGLGPWAAWSRLGSEADLIALGATLLVSWVASWHLRRESGLHEQLRSLSLRAAEAEAAAEALRDLVAGLRTRVDRTSASLSFLRDAAVRLQGTDPVSAAEGAADLALARTGASVVAVEAGEGESRRRLALREADSPETAAHRHRGGADLLVPIKTAGHRVGAIALWGLPHSALDPATAHDLTVIAAWCGPAVAAARPSEDAAVGLLLEAP